MKDYRLPDGKMITIGDERFRCSEILFDPSIIGKCDEGVQYSIVNAINRCPIDVRWDLFNKIMICGGCTMIPNFSERLEQELAKIVKDTIKVKVIAPPDRLYSVWSGSSILASLSTFQDVCINRKTYNEYGPNIVNRSCLYLM